MKGISSGTAVEILVAFLLVLAALKVMTGSIGGLISQGSEQSLRDQVRGVVEIARSKCGDINRQNPLGRDINLETNLDIQTELLLDNSASPPMLKVRKGDERMQWGLPDECGYRFDNPHTEGGKINAESLFTGEYAVWQFTATNDTGTVVLNACNPSQIPDDLNRCVEP